MAAGQHVGHSTSHAVEGHMAGNTAVWVKIIPLVDYVILQLRVWVNSWSLVYDYFEWCDYFVPLAPIRDFELRLLRLNDLFIINRKS